MRFLLGVAIVLSLYTLSNASDKPRSDAQGFRLEQSIDTYQRGVYRFVNPTRKPMGCMVRGDEYSLLIVVEPMTMTVWYYKPNSMNHFCLEVKK